MPFYKVTLEDGRAFKVEADSPPSQDEVMAALGIGQQPQAPQDSGQSYTSSLLNSVGRGAASMVPGAVGGAGYLTGSDALVESAQSIESGINAYFPVNPIYEGEFAMKAANAVGQAGSMLVTGGVGGAVGKIVGAVKAGAEAAALGSGFLSGAREGGQTSDKYGLTGVNRGAMIFGKGALEVVTEKLPFGMAAETGAAKRILGDTIESGWMRGTGAILSESGEEMTSQVGGNALEIGLAPTSAQTPTLFQGTLEAGALGAVGGATFAAVNAMVPQGQQASQPDAKPMPIQAVPGPPDQDNLFGRPYTFNGAQWIDVMPSDPVTGEIQAPRALDPLNPADSPAFTMLEARAAKRRMETSPPSEGNAAANENLSDALTPLDSESIGNLLEAQSTSPEIFRNLNVPTQDRVLAMVGEMAQNSEVLNSIVELVPVDVVDFLRAENLSVEMLLHDEAMLKDMLSGNPNRSIPLGSDGASAILNAVANVARMRAEVRPAVDLTSVSQELGSAVGAGESELHDSAPLLPGAGHAQPLSASVRIPTGEKFLADVIVGDLISSCDGHPSKVTGIYPQGIKPVLRITLDDGRLTRATEDHLWRIRTNGKEMTVRTWEVAAMMQAGMQISLPVAA